MNAREKYTVLAPETPGASPSVIGTASTIREARRLAKPYTSRLDLRWQDVRINDTDGMLVEYAGPSR